MGSRDKTKGTKAIKSLNELGISNFELIEIDIADITSVKQARQVFETKVCSLDILINNGGIAGEQPQNISSFDIDKLHELFNVNYFGVVQTTQQFISLLEKSNAPHIINIFSEVNEVLFLSEKEEATVNGIIDNIQQECHANIDKFSQNIIVSHIETLLNYSERFYERQFITRKIINNKILDHFETVLNNYFSNNDQLIKGISTMQFIADELNISSSYLSRILKTLTKQSTQQLIHQKLIEKAKEKLSTTNLSISEIAFELGFEYPQSFNKLFKSKTNLTPQDFRQFLTER